MHAVAERVREEEQAPAAEAPRPSRRHGVHEIQRTVGNRAVRRALQRNARGTGRLDPAEIEAERSAAAVLGASGLGPAPRRCACGGLVLGGGECARCRAAGVQRRSPGASPAEGTVAATPAVDRVLAMPGRALDPGVRSQMEPHFGADFGDVRVHTGREAGAAARSVDAEAFTAGSDIVFDDGRYAPEAGEGKRLLAHELTHVRQQAGGERQVARQPYGGSWMPEYQDFQKRVFAAATARLRENDAKLDEWRTFINSRFDDLELKGQVGATEAEALIQTAYTGHRIEYLEPYFSAQSPASRRLDEAIINHEINGACEACHESQTVWRWNAEHRREWENAPTTALELARLADYTEFRRTMRGELPAVNRVDPAALGAFVNATTPAQTGPTAATQPAAAAPAAPPEPAPAPATIVYPKPRSDLCGELPAAESVPTIAPSSLGPSTALAVQAIARIHPVLQPLGPQGYRVLPTHIFSELYNSSPAQLQAMVMDNIAERQEKYRWLQRRIAGGHVDYYELCPIVDELLPTASSAVQSVVLWDIAEHQFWQTVLDIVLAIVGAAMLLLMVMFPPAAFIVGTGLAALQVVSGFRDIRRGYLQEAGIGAGIYSPRQEAEAPGLIAGGYVSLISGSIGLAASGFTIGMRLAARPVPTTALQTAGRTGSGRFVPLADGSYMAIHPQNPNFVVMQEGSMLRAGPMIEGELFPVWETEAPWGSGPPPGTPTWAEYSAGWGSGGTGGGTSWGGGFAGPRALPAGPGQLLLPAGPEPFGLLGPGPSPSGLLPAGPTPLMLPPGPEPFGLLGPGPAPAGLPAGPTPYGLLGPGPAPAGLLPAGPTPYGLLGPGPAPFGLLPAGRTPFLLPAGPTPYGLLAPGEAAVVPPAPRGPLMLPAGPTPYGLLGPGPMGPMYGPAEPLVAVKIEGPNKGQFWYEGSRQFQRYGGSPTAPLDQRYIVMPLTDAQALGFRPAGTPPSYAITPRTTPSGGLAESLGAGRLTPHPITARTTRAAPAPGATPAQELVAPDINPSAAWAFPRTIGADLAQMQGYNRLLDLGERGILRPGNVSTGGVDAITAEVSGGRAKIYLNDFTSPGTPKASKPTHIDWAGELTDATAGNRLNFNDPAVESAIRQAVTDGEVYVRTVRVETTGTSPQPIVTVGQATKVSP